MRMNWRLTFCALALLAITTGAPIPGQEPAQAPQRSPDCPMCRRPILSSTQC